MNYYALQVKTGSEELYIRRIVQTLSPEQNATVRFIFPRRKMPRRKGGIQRSQLESVFPGYVFLETEELPQSLYWAFRTTPGFYRYLPDNKAPKPLEGRDLATLKHFTAFGGIADKSKVTFDENDRIHVAEGPLKGLEGRIVKVDKRKGRAKIKLDLYDESFLIDLAFELLDQGK